MTPEERSEYDWNQRFTARVADARNKIASLVRDKYPNLPPQEAEAKKAEMERVWWNGVNGVGGVKNEEDVREHNAAFKAAAKKQTDEYQKGRAIAGMEAWFSDEGDGKTKMLLETPLIWAAYKKGIATQADVLKSWASDTKNAAMLMSKNKDTALEIEKMKEEGKWRIAQLRASRDPKADMAERVYALHRKMGEDDATATRAEASFIEHGDKTDLDKLRETDLEESRAERRVDSILKPFVDPAGGYDEHKMAPSRTLDIYNSLMKTDKKCAAALYLRLPDANRATIDAQNSSDVITGTKRQGAGQTPTAKPSAAPKGQPKSEQPAQIQKDGKDWYLWSDGKYHSKGPEA
jgi:hypothetical protein